jgi:transposase
LRKTYPSNLLNTEWKAIEKHFEVDYSKGGRPVRHEKREILNAIFYVLRTGCQWRYLPQEFPPWKTVYTYFRNWRNQNLFETINHCLRKSLRKLMNRNEEPSAAIVDSQSVKTTEKGGPKVMMAQKKSMVGKDIF